MWPFPKKIPASEGLASVTISVCLTCVGKLGPSWDALRSAAAITGYFRSTHSEFAVPAEAVSRFVETVWPHLVKAYPSLHDKFVTFAICSVRVEELLKKSGKVKGFEEFYDWLAEASSNVSWGLPKNDFLDMIITLTGAGQHLIHEKKSSWLAWQ